MTARPLFIVALSLAVLMGSVRAMAADPAFCRQYARAALVQIRGALQDQRCGAALQGQRWSADFSAHYEWCLGASTEDIDRERVARTHDLKSCH